MLLAVPEPAEDLLAQYAFVQVAREQRGLRHRLGSQSAFNIGCRSRFSRFSNSRACAALVVAMNRNEHRSRMYALHADRASRGCTIRSSRMSCTRARNKY